MADDPGDFYGQSDFEIDDREVESIRRSRTVRWTAILVVASFALAGLSSLFRWW